MFSRGPSCTRRLTNASRPVSVDDAAALVPLHHDTLVAVGWIEALLSRGFDGHRTTVVHQQGELHVALILAHERPQVAEPDAKIGVAVVELLLRHVLLEKPRCGEHELR